MTIDPTYNDPVRKLPALRTRAETAATPTRLACLATPQVAIRRQWVSAELSRPCGTSAHEKHSDGRMGR